MKRPVVWIGILLVLAAGGAAWYVFQGQGLNLAQLREKYGTRYDAKREQLKKIAGLLPAKGSVTANTPAKGLDPSPVHDVKQLAYNTEIAMFDQLLDPDVDLRAKKEVDLLLFNGGLIQNLRILGPKSVLSSNVRATGKALESYEKSLTLPYLVVIRPVTFVRPVYIDRKTYTPGMADLEAFLVDLRTDRVLGSCRLTANSAAQTTAAFRKGEDEKESVECAAYSTLWEDARAKLAVALREITGGTFVFKN